MKDDEIEARIRAAAKHLETTLRDLLIPAIKSASESLSGLADKIEEKKKEGDDDASVDQT